MTRPSAREFGSRWWELRPGSTGVLVMTIGIISLTALTGWPAWTWASAVIVVTAAWCALMAVLELSNEAHAEPGEPAEDTAPATPVGGAFAVDDETDRRRVTLKPEGTP